jgi:hypothetical protein
MPTDEDGSSGRARSLPAQKKPSAEGGGDLEGIVLEEYEGKRRTVVSDPQSVDAAGTNSKVRSSKQECGLFYLCEPLGSKTCGCIIGSGNGIERFCLSAVEEGKISCAVKAHSNNAKAVTAPHYAWFITTMVRGRSGGPAAVRHKFIRQSDAHPSFWGSLDEDEMSPEEWEVLFERARLACTFGEEEAT